MFKCFGSKICVDMQILIIINIFIRLCMMMGLNKEMHLFRKSHNSHKSIALKYLLKLLSLYWSVSFIWVYLKWSSFGILYISNKSAWFIIHLNLNILKRKSKLRLNMNILKPATGQSGTKNLEKDSLLFTFWQWLLFFLQIYTSLNLSSKTNLVKLLNFGA